MNFFNNNTSQLAIVAFLDWFSKLSIEKYQTITVSGDDYYAQRKVIPVPCQWSTREKFVEIMRSSSARKAMSPDIRDRNPVEMQWVLPRIGANLTGVAYDTARRLIKTQQVDDIRNSSDSKVSAYSPTPYNLNLEVYTISRNIDENFQLMEQIIPYFSPAMSLNLKLQSGTIESVPIVLNSITMDNPTDIPENDERLFTNTYTFTMKLNYYVPKKTVNITNGITINTIKGVEVLKIDKNYIDGLNIIQNKFSEYISNASISNPGYGTVDENTLHALEEAALIDSILKALGNPQVIAIQNLNGTLSLETPGISGINSSMSQYIKVFYRIDDIDTIHTYIDPLPITFSFIHYWINLSTTSDNTQLEVYKYTVI